MLSRPPVMDHPMWSVFRRWIRVSIGSQNQSHMDVVTKVPESIRREMLKVRVPCHCGTLHNPFRASHGSRKMQLYATGERMNGHWYCSYKGIAREQVLTLTSDLLAAEKESTESKSVH